MSVPEVYQLFLQAEAQKPNHGMVSLLFDMVYIYKNSLIPVDD